MSTVGIRKLMIVIKEIYQEIRNNNDLRSFLDIGADKILYDIKHMYQHIRVLDTTKHEPTREKEECTKERLFIN